MSAKLVPPDIVIEDVAEAHWDQRLLAAGDPHPFQSSGYAACLAAGGSRILPLELRNAHGPVGWCSVAVGPDGLAHWLYGPVTPRHPPLAYDRVLGALLRHLPRAGIRGVAYATTQVRYEGEEERWVHPCCAGTGATPVVDLRGSGEALFRSFHASVRKNVRKCERAGVQVDFTDDPLAVARYARLVRGYRERLRLPLPPFFPQEPLLPFFSRPSTRMRVALARVGGEDLAGLGLLIFGRVVVEVGVGQTDSYEARRLPAHDLIKAAVAEQCRAQGLAFYDVAGIRKEPRSEKEANIRRFKLKFAGRCAEFAVIDRWMLSPLGAVTRRVVRRVRRLLPFSVSHG